MWPFKWFLFVHVTTGAIGLVLFWLPVFGKKGSQNHKKFGTVYARLMLVTASMAIGMGVNTILAPVATHNHLADWPPARVQGIFGWMMLYLAILTSAAKIGGPEILKALDDNADGAWTAEPIKQAAAAWAGW